MKNQRMSVKRRPVRKGAVRTLFANVAKKKKRQRAATAAPVAEMEGDVPNLGIARALMVILLIHVVAIGGIFVHSRWIDHREAESAPEAVAAPVVEVSVTPAEEETQPLPMLRQGDELYTVGAGDSYESIAERRGVSEEELRRANDNIPLRAGRRLRVPPKTIVAVEPAAISGVREQRRLDPVVEAPPQQPVLVETLAAERADARVVRPTGTTAAPASAGRRNYQVKSGDTFWGIAQKHGTTVDAVMKANGIKDPRRLRAGMTLVIPN